MSYQQMSRNKKMALEHFLDPHNKSVVDVAKASGLTERTLRNYLSDQDFQTALKIFEGQAIDLATRRLLNLVDLSIDVLENILKGEEKEDASNKRLAAQTVINSLLSLRTLRDVENRISNLEKELRDVQEKSESPI